MYAAVLALLTVSYVGHYYSHGYDWAEMFSYTLAVVVIITLAIKDRRDR